MPNDQTLIESNQILRLLEESNFNLGLAAEKLHISQTELLVNITPDHEAAILVKMRIKVAFESFKLWDDVKLIFLAALGEAEPLDVIKAFNNLTVNMTKMFEAQSVHNSTQPNTNNGLMILNMLPPDVREAMVALLASRSDPETDAPLPPDAPRIMTTSRRVKPDDDDY